MSGGDQKADGDVGFSGPCSTEPIDLSDPSSADPQSCWIGFLSFAVGVVFRACISKGQEISFRDFEIPLGKGVLHPIGQTKRELN